MMNEEKKKIISCGAVTWRAKKKKIEILLIKQFANKDSWGIPKGHIDDNESIEDCAAREVLEETGVRVKLESRLPDCHTSFKNEHKTVISFLATPEDSKNQEPNIDHPDCEVDAAAWTLVDNLPKIHIYQQSLIDVAIDVLKQRLGFKQSLNENVMNALKFVYSYASDVDDWLTIKKEILRELKPEDRTQFSTRDHVTKKQVPNHYDKLVAWHWSEMSGRQVIFSRDE